jgi:hypothetical protein
MPDINTIIFLNRHIVFGVTAFAGDDGTTCWWDDASVSEAKVVEVIMQFL